MKKTLWVRIACFLLAGLLLTGCTLGKKEESQEVKDDRQKLESILDDIADIMDPDKATSKLAVLRVTVDLINWARNSSLTADQTTDTVSNWLDTHPDQKDRLMRNLESVGESFSSILEGTAGKLLETFGDVDLSDLGGSISTLIDSILNSGK